MIHVVVIRVVDAAAVRRARRRRTAAITGLVVPFAGFAWVLAMVPPFVGFVFAVGAAVGWCVWLEKCPEATPLSSPVVLADTELNAVSSHSVCASKSSGSENRCLPAARSRVRSARPSPPSMHD